MSDGSLIANSSVGAVGLYCDFIECAFHCILSVIHRIASRMPLTLALLVDVLRYSQ